jgi:hypothetical protein
MLLQQHALEGTFHTRPVVLLQPCDGTRFAYSPQLVDDTRGSSVSCDSFGLYQKHCM